jgi:para-aminobenzoate synthetase component 1
VLPGALIQEIRVAIDPWGAAQPLLGTPGMVLLESQQPGHPCSRFSFLAGRPFLRFRSYGSLCVVFNSGVRSLFYGNPWQVLGQLLARYEMPVQPDVPFPVGGAFGFWGFGLAPFSEPALRGLKDDNRELPDCDIGFHDSLLVFDHELGRVLIVASGLGADGSRTRARAMEQRDRWLRVLDHTPATMPPAAPVPLRMDSRPSSVSGTGGSREWFVRAVTRAREYIRQGDIYQVNLSRRLRGPTGVSSAGLYHRFRQMSPAPFAMYMEGGDWRLASHSPELFLRMSGLDMLTRPIKGTRPRAGAAEPDAAARRDLLTSEKERAELLMITDLMRNDLGRLCEYGSVQVPELRRLEPHGAVHQAVATICGRLRPDLDHVRALAGCFPGGSVTGAPKIRALELIDELEPVARGPYTGCGGYLGFNRESQVNLLIRTAIFERARVWFHTGAGIVADSCPEAEFAETEAKAAVFRRAAALCVGTSWPRIGECPPPTVTVK